MNCGPKAPNKSEQAFLDYLKQPLIQKALEMTNGALSENLLRDSFFAGAQHAIQRCAEEHHQPKVRKN